MRYGRGVSDSDEDTPPVAPNSNPGSVSLTIFSVTDGRQGASFRLSRALSSEAAPLSGQGRFSISARPLDDPRRRGRPPPALLFLLGAYF